jgi:peptidyl-tRNA hydrolase, PTH1 family
VAQEPNAPEPVRLVAGLGNPGPEYEFTPHNLGFMVVDRLAERNHIRITRKESQALAGVGAIGRGPVVLAKPQTYVNLSGHSIRSLMAKHQVAAKDLIVVYDELDLPWTAVRIRLKGSAGGHHGIESVIKAVGSQDFPRVRLGIHPGHPIRDGAAFVLAPMKRAQRDELDELLDYASQAVEFILAEGVELAMTRFNRRARG